jgi:hypothetical protein
VGLGEPLPADEVLGVGELLLGALDAAADAAELGLTW